jgi:hypothetical protein
VKTPVTHKLGPEWAQHCAEVIAQIRNTELQAWALEGQAAHNRKEVERMRSHLLTLKEQFVLTEKLPPSITPYEFSADGSALVGVVERQETQ